MSNQETLGNGCICETGCDSCDRLAEAWTAMREALHSLVIVCDTHIIGGPRIGAVDSARAALTLADRVKVRQPDGGE